MKKIIILIFSISLVIISSVYGEHAIMKDKATGKILMSNSSPNPNTYKTLMEKDALSSGIDLNSVEIKIVSDAEFNQIQYDTVIKPAQDKKAIDDAQRKTKLDALKTKLNLTDDDIEVLRDD